MAGNRYVLLGLAHPRSAWFREVALWANEASIPAEFIKCITPEEVRARLASGRSHSALVVDATLGGFDRDLVAVAAAASTPVIAVAGGRTPTWSAEDIGVAAVLGSVFSRKQLMDALESHAAMIGRADEVPPALSETPVPAWRGRLIAVTGPGGTGASTAAIALAQALGSDPRYGGRVLLADLALRADQAMLHDAGEVGPGVQELVDAHRLGRPTPGEIEACTFSVPARNYRLLLGLRRPAAWAALRPRAFDAALEGMRSAFQAVVADVTGDVEGEAEGGSVDVEERNHMARATVSCADAVVVVGAHGLKGAHSQAQLLRSLIEAGVPPARLLPAVSRPPRNPRSRAGHAAALATLVGDGVALPSPVPIPERKVEEALRDGVAMPDALCAGLAAALHVLVHRLADAKPPLVSPQPVAPGSMGGWYEIDEDASSP